MKIYKKHVLFNKESKLVMRSQDKRNMFFIVDKETDKIKTQQQIAKRSFQELKYDPTKEYVKNVEQWRKKMALEKPNFQVMEGVHC